MMEKDKEDCKWIEALKSITQSSDLKHIVSVLAWLTGQISLVGLVFWLLLRCLK